MTIQKSVIEQAIYNWLTTVSPAIPVFWLNQTAPRPAKPYVSVIYQVLNRIHHDYEYGHTNAYGDIEHTGNREFTLHLQWYGQGGFEGLQAYHESLEFGAIREVLLQAGIVYVQSMMPVTDISQLVDEEFESRYTHDILFRIADDYLDTHHPAGAGWIDTVNINGDIDGRDLSTITVTNLP